MSAQDCWSAKMTVEPHFAGRTGVPLLGSRRYAGLQPAKATFSGLAA